MRYRIAGGLPTVSIALLAVLDIAAAADNGLIEALKILLGVTMTVADLHTTIKGAIIEPSSGFAIRRQSHCIPFRVRK